MHTTSGFRHAAFQNASCLVITPPQPTGSRTAPEGGEPYTLKDLSNATIDHLQPGVAYEVRAATSLAPTIWSDPVVHRTKDPHLESLDMYRIAEGCGDKCVAPDYLYNHDSGDAASDIWFITSSEHHRRRSRRNSSF